MHRRRVFTPVEQLQPFERGRIVDLWEAGWTYRRITAHVGHNVSVVCRCLEQWSVEHSHARRPGSVWPYGTDAHKDGRIVQAAVAARTAFREEIWSNISPAVSQRTSGNRLLAEGLRSRVPLSNEVNHSMYLA